MNRLSWRTAGSYLLLGVLLLDSGPTTAVTSPMALTEATLPTTQIASTNDTASSLSSLTVSAPGTLSSMPLSNTAPKLLPTDLLALARPSALAATAGLPATPVLPALAPCRFGTANIELNFGQIPTGVDASLYARPFMLQVECSKATEFMISAQEPPLSVGTAAERSAIVVTLRGPAGTYTGQAWALLEQDGQPLASRRFSVPAASPTLIAVNALLLASPNARLTPTLPGQLESLMLARQLYLVDTLAP